MRLQSNLQKFTDTSIASYLAISKLIFQRHLLLYPLLLNTPILESGIKGGGN